MKYAIATVVCLFAGSLASACDIVESAVFVRSRPVILRERVLVDRGAVNSVNIVNSGRRGTSVVQASSGGGSANVQIVNQQRGLFGRVRSTQVIQASAGR